MYFTNPLGLLGLVAVPTIIALHYFRSQRREVQIGGLHLWSFARRRQPEGRRWQRLESTVSLLLQIFAAVLLSLLLAGAKLRTRPEMQHFIVVLDASASMSAQNPSMGRSPAEEARDLLRDQMTERTQWTLVEAGLDPTILAGPGTGFEEARNALEEWHPDKPASDLAKALNLARRFAAPLQPVLHITDHKFEGSGEPGEDMLERLYVLALGEPASNTAIVFADRYRSGPGTDRLTFVLRHFGPQSISTQIRVLAGRDLVAAREIELQPERPRRLELEIDRIDDPVNVLLPDDALDLDHRLVLAPVEPRVQPVANLLDDLRASYLQRALEVIPDALGATSPDRASIVVLGSAARNIGALAEQLGDRYPRTTTFVVLRDIAETDPLALAEKAFVPGRHGRTLLEGVGLEGLLWTYAETAPQGFQNIVLSHEGTPLVAMVENQRRQLVIWINVALEASNLPRSPAWPILLYNVVRTTQRRLPGPARRNVRAGEELELRTGQLEGASWELVSTTGERRTLYPVPPLLTNLGRGYYELIATPADDPANPVRFPFAVNLFAPEESDLRNRDFAEVEWTDLGHDTAATDESRPLLFYLLLALFTAVLAGLWAYQERSA